MKCAIVLNTPLHPKRESGSEGNSPRKDYFLLAELLGAEIIAPPASTNEGKVGGFGGFVKQAWYAFKRRNEYDTVLTMSEQVGLILALLFKITRTNKTHVMISHYMTPARKSMFIKLLQVDSRTSLFQESHFLSVLACHFSSRDYWLRSRSPRPGRGWPPGACHSLWITFQHWR